VDVVVVVVVVAVECGVFGKIMLASLKENAYDSIMWNVVVVVVVVVV